MRNFFIQKEWNIPTFLKPALTAVLTIIVFFSPEIAFPRKSAHQTVFSIIVWTSVQLCKNKMASPAPNIAAAIPSVFDLAEEVHVVEDSDSDFEVFPGEDVEPPEGLPGLDEGKEARDYRRLFQSKIVTHDWSRVFTGLGELAKALFPEEHSLLTAPDGPLVESYCRDQIPQGQLKEWVFAELLRIQGALGIRKQGEYLL